MDYKRYSRSMNTYTEGQSVEVITIDFKAPGMPKYWAPATITAIEVRDDGLSNLSIIRDDGTYAHQIVGKRGGGKNVRVAS